MNLGYDPSTPGVVKQDPEITVWLKTLGERIEQLNKIAESLTKHLDPILTPQPDIPNAEKATSALPNVSPMADTLREFDRRIRIAISILEHAANRLEI